VTSGSFRYQACEHRLRLTASHLQTHSASDSEPEELVNDSMLEKNPLQSDHTRKEIHDFSFPTEFSVTVVNGKFTWAKEDPPVLHK